MSMLDSFFNKGFKGAKCKTLLKLAIPRIKLLRNRREIQLKQMRKEIAKLLENGQEATARIRVEHIIREENMMAAQEILELFCELIAVHIPIIETQRECPLDLKEAISTICFAAPRCSDLPELQQIQMLFAAKYGREFVAAATELMPNCGVNRQVIELLSVRAPAVEAKLKLLKEIAEEHELDWDHAASETEFLKPHDDLLNGPSYSSGSTLPLPKEKHEDFVASKHTEENEDLDSDSGFDSFDLPDVPKVSVRTTTDNLSAPEIITSPVKYSPPSHLDLDHEYAKPSLPSIEEPEVYKPEPSIPVHENEQIRSMPSSSISSSPKQVDDQSPSVASPSSPIFATKHSDPVSSPFHTRTDGNIDLQDVLSAARAAAESAERAATAARAAASLAQIRITELIKNKNDSQTFSENCDGEVRPIFDQQDSFRHEDHVPHYDRTLSSESGKEEETHQPQRSTSIEEDPYFSYPNLFSRQGSDVKHDTDAS